MRIGIAEILPWTVLLLRHQGRLTIGLEFYSSLLYFSLNLSWAWFE